MIKHTNSVKRKLYIVVLLSAVFAAGCSGSGSATSAGDSESAPVENAQDQASGNGSTIDSDDSSSSHNTTVPVTFNITVPEYVSNALQVRVSHH